MKKNVYLYERILDIICLNMQKKKKKDGRIIYTMNICEFLIEWSAQKQRTTEQRKKDGQRKKEKMVGETKMGRETKMGGERKMRRKKDGRERPTERNIETRRRLQRWLHLAHECCGNMSFKCCGNMTDIEIRVK